MAFNDTQTIAAYDETQSLTRIQQGTALTFAIPKALPFRQIYFYVQPKLAVQQQDFWIRGEVVLTSGGQPRCALPASVGVNQNNTGLNKTIWSAFASQAVYHDNDGNADIGCAEPGFAIVALSNPFVSNNLNLLALAPRSVIAVADRFNYVIEDWSRAGSGIQEVTGFRCIALVISSNEPFP